MKRLASNGSTSQAEPGPKDVDVDEDRSHIRVRAEDPDLDEAVEDVLADIHYSLGGDDDEPLISFEELEDDQLDDDEQVTQMYSTLPPPALLAELPPRGPAPVLPEADGGLDADDSQRITMPEVLAGAIVYAPPSVEVDPDDEEDGWPFDEDDEPATVAVAAAPTIDEPAMELDPPPSLRPISRTSLPPYREPTPRRYWVAAALAMAAMATVWLVWPQRQALDSRLSDSAVTVALAVHRSMAKQGFQATSQVGEVRVRVDGVDRGLLPVALDDLSIGVHQVRFEAPGHAPLERTVQIKAGELIDLGSIELSSVAHRVYLNLDPPNAFAQIREVGKSTGRRFPGPWPRYIDLEPGRYEITAFRAGFEPVARQFEVQPGGEMASLRIELAREDIYEE